MRQPVLNFALAALLTLAAGSVTAQEGAAPVIPQSAPSQPAAPQSEPSTAIPAAVEAAIPQGQEGNVLPPAEPAGAVSAAADATTTPVVTPAPVAAPAPHLAEVHTDLYTIVISSHWVVLSVMALLAVAAFAVLVIFIHKLTEYFLVSGSLNRSARNLARAKTLAEAQALTRDHKGPAAEMIRAAAHELELAQADPALRNGVRERTSSALARIDAGAAQRLRGATGILASIGSLSPFIGLFGTVFGIMNSFLAIAASKTTNLAVVAPGIAEALFATAIGLAAAIPAVLVYNICSRKLAKYRNSLGDVAAATERLQSRDLDRLAAGV